MPRPSLPTFLAILAVTPFGCGIGLGGDPDCVGGKCDEADDVRSQLDGLDEPIADWLRASPMDRNGILETDYESAMEQLARFSNCEIDTLKSFVVSDDLVAGVPFPRLVSTLCSNDPSKAADLFVAASFRDPKNRNDVDRRNLEMFAWDKTQKRNVFYALTPVKGSDTLVQVAVEPKACEGCHLNGDSLDKVGMPMLPIMNELVTPWPHWNAEPDFPSHSFEMPAQVTQAPTFAALTAGSRLGSASDLEQIIRAAQTNRVIAERLKTRRNKPANLGQAMSLLRPIFCDEQLNYVTEDHGSSVLPSQALVTGGTREMFLAIAPSAWPWGWLNDGRIRFASSSESPLTMIPVRGNVDVEFIRRLVAVGALDAEKVLRVLALDWTRPVGSEFRCNLWKDARARLRGKSSLAIEPDTRNLHLFDDLYTEIMTLDGEVSLVTGESSGVETEIVTLARGENAEMLKVAIGNQTLAEQTCETGFCQTSLHGFGDLLEVRVGERIADGGRELLDAESEQRFCFVRENFPNRPALPSGRCVPKEPQNSPKNQESGLPDPSAGENFDVRLIPDGNPTGVVSPIEIEPTMSGAIPTFISVRVHLEHSWRGDIDIALVAPSGHEFFLASFAADDSANDVDEEFFILDPPETITPFGDWRLRVVDRQSGERGHLLAWTLGLNRLSRPTAPPGTRPDPR